jgi:hypothetical protein
MRAMARRPSILAALLLLLVPGVAQGAIRLGPDVTIPPPSGGFHLGAIGCQPAAEYNPCSYLNVASTNPDVVVVSPVKGVITSWSFRAGCCTDPQTVAHHITLGTFRPDGFGAGGYFSTTAHLQGDTFELPPGNAILADTPTTLKARVPIEAGEVIGAIADDPIAFAVNDTIKNVTYTVLFKGFTYGNAYTAATIYLSALVEPDADGDGFGDETQDCAPADAAVHEGCAPTSPPVVLPPPPDPLSVGCNAPVCAGTTPGGGSGTPAPPPTPAPVPKTGTIAPPSDPNSVYISLACPPNVPQYCGGYLILVPGGAKKAASARTRYAIAPGKTKAIKIPLTAKLRKQLGRTGRTKVTLRLQPDGGAKATTFTRTIKLKKKARR